MNLTTVNMICSTEFKCTQLEGTKTQILFNKSHKALVPQVPQMSLVVLYIKCILTVIKLE